MKFSRRSFAAQPSPGMVGFKNPSVCDLSEYWDFDPDVCDSRGFQLLLDSGSPGQQRDLHLHRRNYTFRKVRDGSHARWMCAEVAIQFQRCFNHNHLVEISSPSHCSHVASPYTSYPGNAKVAARSPHFQRSLIVRTAHFPQNRLTDACSCSIGHFGDCTFFCQRMISSCSR